MRRLSLTQLSAPFTGTPFYAPPTVVCPLLPLSRWAQTGGATSHGLAPRLPLPSPSAEGRAGLFTRLSRGKRRASVSPRANSSAPQTAKGTTPQCPVPLLPGIKTHLRKRPLCAGQTGAAPFRHNDCDSDPQGTFPLTYTENPRQK